MTPTPSPPSSGSGRPLAERATRNNFDQRDSSLGRLVPYRPARAAPMPPARSWGWQVRGRPRPDWRPLPGCCVAKCHQPLRSTGQADLTPDLGGWPPTGRGQPARMPPTQSRGCQSLGCGDADAAWSFSPVGAWATSRDTATNRQGAGTFSQTLKGRPTGVIESEEALRGWLWVTRKISGRCLQNQCVTLGDPSAPSDGRGGGPYGQEGDGWGAR
jgi:hypothetical protein